MAKLWYKCPGCGEKVLLSAEYLIAPGPNVPRYAACCECLKCGWRSPYGRSDDESEARIKAMGYLDDMAKEWVDEVRPIDAIALKKRILENYGEQATIDGLMKSGIIDAINEIERQPTLKIEPPPPAHAHWIKSILKDGGFFCSKCGETTGFSRERNEYYKTAYCPTCGAEMDEETAQEENRK